MLDLAISDWIVTHGRPSCDTAPLRYGEAFVLARPWSDGKTIQLGQIIGPSIQFPTRNGLPLLDLGPITAVRLESLDGRRANAAVLAGDRVRIKLIPGNSYVGPNGQYLGRVDDVSRAVSFTIMLQDDDLGRPSRLGEYLLEPDLLGFMTGQPGNPEKVVGIAHSSRDILLIDDPEAIRFFSLKRCDDTQI